MNKFLIDYSRLRIYRSPYKYLDRRNIFLYIFYSGFIVCLLLVILFVYFMTNNFNKNWYKFRAVRKMTDAHEYSTNESGCQNAEKKEEEWPFPNSKINQTDLPRLLCPEEMSIANDEFIVETRSPEMEEIEKEFPELDLGGHWRPTNCSPSNRVAIILPYRNRMQHLRTFLLNLHRFMQKQRNLEYAIFVVEEFGNLTFNRGRLLNIGFLEAKKLFPWQCFVFHDIDAIPENIQNAYNCPNNSNIVKHMAVGFQKHGYKLLYPTYFSGALIFNVNSFRRVNGYSNDFWGWGGEDDDLYKRVQLSGLTIARNSDQIARYKQLDHEVHEKGNKPNPCRFELLKRTNVRQSVDGLNNLQYLIKSIEFNRLYTLIKVDLLADELEKWKNEIKSIKGC